MREERDNTYVGGQARPVIADVEVSGGRPYRWL